jgi:type IV secretion system protein VirD4
MKTREKIIICSILFVVGGVVNIFFSTALHLILSRQSSVLRLAPLGECLSSIAGSRQHFILFLCLQGFIIILSLMFFLTNLRPYQSDLLRVTPDIETPVPVGQHQHGSSRWLTDREKNKVFESYTLNPNNSALQYLIKHGEDDLKDDNKVKGETAGPPPEDTCEDGGKSRESEQTDYPAFSIKRGGVVLGMKKEDDTEQIYYVGDDTHTLTIGATRSGKTRSVVLQSICTIGLAGESMIISDPKAELYHYSAPLLRRLGYEVMALDFKNPEKSQHYNLLQPIIDAAKAGNMERAEMLAARKQATRKRYGIMVKCRSSPPPSFVWW